MTSQYSDAEGFIYIQDRIKDMIISGGENVYPAEIEDVLLSHPGIADVSVVAMRSVKWGESPLAVVVRADPELDEAAVLAHSIGKLARFKQPKRAVFVDVIPHAHGKSTQAPAARTVPGRRPWIVTLRGTRAGLAEGGKRECGPPSATG